MDTVAFRLEILLDLYNQSLKRGMLRSSFSEDFNKKYPFDDNDENFNEEQLKLFLFNLEYLEDKSYLDISWGTQRRIFAISLTSLGCDVAEFALYGESIETKSPGSGFQALMEKITKSGISVLEGSAIGLVNIAIQSLLK